MRLSLEVLGHFFLNRIFFFWLCWAFIAVLGLFLAAASRGAVLRCGGQAFQCGGFSCCRAQALGMRAWQFWCMDPVAP